MIFIAITTGDEDGIGLEVSAKALVSIGPQKNKTFVLYRSEKADKRYLRLIDKKFKRIVFSSWPEAKAYLSSQKKSTPGLLIDLQHTKKAPHWVEEAARYCHQKIFSALVTAPLSKELIQSCGLKDMGHTGILKRVSETSSVNMGFVGPAFNVVLATDHISLKEVSTNLTLQKATVALSNAKQLRSLLSTSRKKLPIAFLGLNPHAGENGLIGDEESLWLKKFCQENCLTGPLSPDAAFQKPNWKRFSVFIASYHDQGLIPFKLVHGQNSGFHITLGLSFLRTSVDHGTAKDIFGKNIANPNSMKEAIRFTLK